MTQTKKMLNPQPQFKLEKGWVEYLKNIELFSEISSNDEALKKIAMLLEERFITAGENIIIEGVPGSEMFILIHGKASVYKSTTEGELYKVAVFDGKVSTHFGEGGLLETDARSATIKADTDCYCLVWNQEYFEQFCKDEPELALPVLRRVARGVLSRLKKTNEDLSLLYHALVAEIRGG
ncbi:MAG: cyclic nucleotide-binding domain-containing protein [Bdellovibrio sp.]|nr:cyclic nucleotide-binding domain-containing protein [Bdellovibrio sp.]